MEFGVIRDPIKEITTWQEVLRIPTAWNGGLSDLEFLHIGGVTRAIWRHSGDPARPHTRTRAGLCTDGYFDLGKILTFSNVGEILAKQLVAKLGKCLGDVAQLERMVKWAVSSDHSGAPFVRDVGRVLGCRNDFCVKGFRHSLRVGGRKIFEIGEEQRWNRSVIEARSCTLHVEELVSGLKTAKLVRLGVRSGNPYPVDFLPMLGTIVHRPATEAGVEARQIEDGLVIPLYYFPTNVWKRRDCPLCAAGSRLIEDPKTNWDELNVA